MQSQTLMLVRIHCSDGSVGVGEGTTSGGLAYGAESPEGMKLAIDTYFTPLLTGADADAVPAVMARIHNAIRDNRFAKCAVETALYDALGHRSEEHTSEIQSLMRISYAVFCLKKKTQYKINKTSQSR